MNCGCTEVGYWVKIYILLFYAFVQSEISRTVLFTSHSCEAFEMAISVHWLVIRSLLWAKLKYQQLLDGLPLESWSPEDESYSYFGILWLFLKLHHEVDIFCVFFRLFQLLNGLPLKLTVKAGQHFYSFSEIHQHWWTGTKFGTDIHGSKTMYPNNFGDPEFWTIVPSLSQKFSLSSTLIYDQTILN